MENRRVSRPFEARASLVKGGARFVPKRRVCPFCGTKAGAINYKDAEKLRGFISETGKIEPRRKTGACAKHQRALAVAIKRARHLALIPYTAAHVYTRQILSKSE